MLHRSPHARHRRTGQRARRASAPTLATVRPPGSSERTRAGGPRGCSPASPLHANSQAWLAHRVRRKRQWPSVQRDRAARSIGPDSALSVHQKRSVYSCQAGWSHYALGSSLGLVAAQATKQVSWIRRGHDMRHAFFPEQMRPRSARCEAPRRGLSYKLSRAWFEDTITDPG
jgi:hypothetical protein